jgi:HemY protein
MRVLLWILVICALAVGVTLIGRGNAGYALFVLPPHRVEISLNLLVIMLIVAFVVAYFVVRTIAATFGVPAQVRRYRNRRQRDKARTALLATLREFFGHHHGRAEKNAAKSMKRKEYTAVSSIIAARAAHELHAYDRRDAYLEQAAAAATPEQRAMCRITRAELLFDEQRYDEAAAALEPVAPGDVAALQLELRIRQRMQDWERVLELAGRLRKRDVLDDAQTRTIQRDAYAGRLRRCAGDRAALDECWQKTPGRARKDNGVALAGAQCYMALGACGEAHRIIEDSLVEEWSGELAALYGECPGENTVRQIERAERWLEAHPQDPSLLLTLGRLCARQELWGKAQSYLEASLAIKPTIDAHRALAQLHEHLGNADAARRQFSDGLEYAAAQRHCGDDAAAAVSLPPS